MYHFELTNELDPFLKDESLQYVGCFHDFRNVGFHNLVGKKSWVFEHNHPMPSPIRAKEITHFKLIKIKSLFAEDLAVIIVFDFLDEMSQFHDYSKRISLIMELASEQRLLVYHKTNHGQEIVENTILNTELINFFKEQNIIRS